MTLGQVKSEVQSLRNRYGAEICTDVSVSEGIAYYVVMPGEELGYCQEYRLADGAERHCGNGLGCFWTEWS